MTVYTVSGASLVLTGDGNTNIGNILATDSFNPITGAMGPVTVKISNSSNANVAEVVWSSFANAPTYSFPNANITVSPLVGANAEFDVTVTYSGYEVAIANGGDSYVVADLFTIDGGNVGGVTAVNDVTITIDAVSNTGAITAVTATGTPAWPQGPLSNSSVTYVLPNSTDFVQVNNQLGQDTFFTGNCASGNMLITPVQIVG